MNQYFLLTPEVYGNKDTILIDEQSTSTLNKKDIVYFLSPQIRQLRVLPALLIFMVMIIAALLLLGPEL